MTDLQPIIILSGLKKSSMADPSLKNSGFDTTSNELLGFVFFIIFSTIFDVPTGTVDFETITVYPFKFLARDCLVLIFASQESSLFPLSSSLFLL